MRTRVGSRPALRALAGRRRRRCEPLRSSATATSIASTDGRYVGLRSATCDGGTSRPAASARVAAGRSAHSPPDQCAHLRPSRRRRWGAWFFSLDAGESARRRGRPGGLPPAVLKAAMAIETPATRSTSDQNGVTDAIVQPSSTSVPTERPGRTASAARIVEAWLTARHASHCAAPSTGVGARDRTGGQAPPCPGDRSAVAHSPGGMR